MDTGKVGVDDENGLISVGHDGRIAVLMHSSDKDFTGYRMRQVEFGKEATDQGAEPAYFEFEEDWDIDRCDDGEVWTEAFAVALRLWDDGGWHFGRIYLTGDRNPDLTTQNNVKAYLNDD